MPNFITAINKPSLRTNIQSGRFINSTEKFTVRVRDDFFHNCYFYDSEKNIPNQEIGIINNLGRIVIVNLKHTVNVGDRVEIRPYRNFIGPCV